MRIVHEPFGAGNPYAQDPWERFPREPSAGQDVGIGIVVQCADGADARAPIDAWVSWSGADGRTQTAAVVLLHESPEGLAFRAVLPCFPEGERVTYLVHARAGDSELNAGPFTFSIPARHRLTSVLSCAEMEGGLAVDVGTTWPGRIMRMRFSVSPQGSLAIERELVERQAAAGTGGRAPAAAGATVGAFRVSFDGALLHVDRADGTLILHEAEPFSFLVNGEGKVIEARQCFASPADEGFYGFGERFDGLNQRGRTVDNRVFDCYTRQGMKTYLPVPFFLSSRGYGHFIDTRGPVVHGLDSDASGRWSYEAAVHGGIPCTHLFVGKPLEIVRAFTRRTGPAALPPDWAFGPWMSGNEWNSQRRVMEVAERTRDLGIPASVLVIEAWSDEATFSIWNGSRYEPRDPTEPFHLSDFSFPNDGPWPDPKAMIDELHDRGIRVVLWQIPVIKRYHEPHAQHDRDAACVRERGWCVRNADGSPYIVRPPWFRGAMVLDFTNPDAVRWWFDRRRYLVREMGVDGFKTDGGEHLWGDGLRFSDGTSGPDAWNGFVNNYLDAYHAFMKEERGSDGLTFSRAGYTGAQRYPMHWNGDQDSSLESHRCTFFATLNAGLSGIPFVGWDIGGFAGPVPSAEIYLRSAAMALFSPLMQYHSDFNNHAVPNIDRTPWNIAERSGVADVVGVYRRFARARVAMLPYVAAEARHCAETGEPLVRPLFLDWPEDTRTWRCEDEYLFGRSLIVAPVFGPGIGSREVYLPRGQWECLSSGDRFTGPLTVRRPAPLPVIPVFVRAGAAFPREEVRRALEI